MFGDSKSHLLGGGVGKGEHQYAADIGTDGFVRYDVDTAAGEDSGFAGTSGGGYEHVRASLVDGLLLLLCPFDIFFSHRLAPIFSRAESLFSGIRAL